MRLTFLIILSSVLAAGAFASDDLIHVVGKGETIYSISRFYGVSSEDLMKTNGISDPSKLKTGQKLKIPASNDVPAQLSAASVPLNAISTISYKAVKGDTLYSIARAHGISLQNLLDINKFSTNHVLKIGDIIKVPGDANSSAVSGSSNNQSASTSVKTPSGIYSLQWPVSPKEITYMSGQMGVVVEGEQLESVKSLTQGNVVSAGPWRKFGRVVIVETSGGYYYMYGGCESITVSVGDKITPGMELGRLGVNTVSEKPQLFFMVFRNETPMDPAQAPRAGGNSRT